MDTVGILLTAAVAFLANLPLGRLRTRCRRYGLPWFVAIHASIPLIVLLRVGLSIPWAWAPLFVAFAAAGQYLGGRRVGATTAP